MKLLDRYFSVYCASFFFFSTTSEIIQVLLKDIMKGFFHAEQQVRISAFQVVTNILRQGLIHPAQVRFFSCIKKPVRLSTV